MSSVMAKIISMVIERIDTNAAHLKNTAEPVSTGTSPQEIARLVKNLHAEYSRLDPEDFMKHSSEEWGLRYNAYFCALSLVVEETIEAVFDEGIKEADIRELLWETWSQREEGRPWMVISDQFSSPGYNLELIIINYVLATIFQSSYGADIFQRYLKAD